MSLFKKLLMIALIDAILSQFHFLLMPYDFPISLACAILPIYYFFDESINPLKAAAVILTVGVIFRTTTGFYQMGSFYASFLVNSTYMFFDVFYGLIFYVSYYSKKNKSLYLWIMTAIFADFFANTADFLARFNIEMLLSEMMLSKLLLIAFLRVTLAAIIVIGIRKYDSMIKAQEYYERHKKVLALTSNLEGEVYFMKKNMNYIEMVMDDAYNLYQKYDGQSDEVKKQTALRIAKDVHEIKKNYSRVVEGITEIVADEAGVDEMHLDEMMQILFESMHHHLERLDKNIELRFVGKENFIIKEHYLLMSVLRNLVNNSFESIISKGNSGKVKVTYKQKGSELIITVKDDGKGIKESLQNVIFNPGFSTKFDKSTGNASRGLGLSLVKEIVEDKFKGRIALNSKEGVFTKFKVAIPIENL